MKTTLLNQENSLPSDPLVLFTQWLEEAKKTEINDPEAMALATVSADSKPSVRMILLKEASSEGFKFHTNCQSRKGEDLAYNPNASLCFHWKTLRKQVRITGSVKMVSEQEADIYFASRPYGRKIGAWASQQSRPLKDRNHLEQKIEQLEKQYPDPATVPRPSYWVGYRLIPDEIEFWWDNQDRLHDRILFTKAKDNSWATTRLYP